MCECVSVCLPVYWVGIGAEFRVIYFGKTFQMILLVTSILLENDSFKFIFNIRVNLQRHSNSVS